MNVTNNRACFKENSSLHISIAKAGLQFLNDLFYQKSPIYPAKFPNYLYCHCTNNLSSLHISIHHCTLKQVLYYVTYLAIFLPKNLYFRTKYSFMPLSFSQLVLSHASDNTTSRNIGGTDAWAVPHLKFWGMSLEDCPSQSPLSLRPCK